MKNNDEFKRLPNGDFLYSLKLDKEVLNVVYKTALLDNKLTLQDLDKQKDYNKKFKEVVFAAFSVKSLEEFIENYEKTNKPKKQKTNKVVRNNDRRKKSKTKISK